MLPLNWPVFRRPQLAGFQVSAEVYDADDWEARIGTERMGRHAVRPKVPEGRPPEPNDYLIEVLVGLHEPAVLPAAGMGIEVSLRIVAEILGAVFGFSPSLESLKRRRTALRKQAAARGRGGD